MKRHKDSSSHHFDIADGNNVNAENGLFSYDLGPGPTGYKTSVHINNKVKSSSYTDLERESSAPANQKVAESKEVLAGSSDTDVGKKFGDIAFNSREVRLVGPNQKEVEMKDDVATKVVVALENLQKEASDVWSQVNEKLDKGWTDLKRSEVWGQVNGKLDKGWTDLKTMVEGVVAPNRKQN